MQTVRRQWHRPTLLDFNEWLKEKAEGHERLKTINSKGKSEEPVQQKVGTKVFASNANVSNKTKEKPKYPPCSVCKGQHVLWNCAVFKEKNATQRAKHVAEQKLCFACLQSNHSFRNCSRDHIRIGSDSISIPELQEKYPQLAPIKPIHYKYEDVEIIIGQDFYHAIRPVEYLLGEDSISPCAVSLPIGWVLSGPLPPSFKSNSSWFKCVVEDMSLADQIRTWYELESYGAFKQVDARSAADKRALSVLKNDTFHDGERYIVPMLCNDKESSLPNNYLSSLAQLRSLEKRLDKNPWLREKYAETIREDIQKGYVITVKAHGPKSRADREWYLPHHPVLNPNKTGKVRRVLNGASKYHGASLNKSLLVGPDLLQNLIFVLLRFRQHKYAVSADIEGIFLQVGVREEDQPSLRFLWREDPTSSVVVHQYTRHIFGARDSVTMKSLPI